MWDLQVNMAVPTGATFLSVEAPPPFTGSFTGQDVSFSIIELPRSTDFGPLRFKVQINQGTTMPLVSRAWATWKVATRSAGVSEAAVQQLFTGDIIVQPPLAQQVVGDAVGDVPFTNYDLTTLTLQDEEDSLKATFYTADRLCPADVPLQFTLYIDGDCQSNTGTSQRGLGVEYQIRYNFGDDVAVVLEWNETEESWERLARIDAVNPAGQKNVTLSIPYELLQDDHQFCWVGRARNTTDEFVPRPAADWLPDNATMNLVNYQADSLTEISDLPSTAVAPPITDDETEAEQEEANLTEEETTTNSDQAETTSETDQPTPSVTPKTNATSIAACSQPAIASTPSGASESLSGKLAIPLYNDSNFYDIHVFSVPGGQEVTTIANARQPDIRFDGQKMLVNREGGGIEDLYEYNFANGVQQKVGDAPEDAHPAYNLGGNRLTYDNPALIIGAGGDRSPFIFVQCSLLPPHEETDQRCKNIPTFGVLVPAGQTGEVQGRHPVWTEDDRIAFKGCNSWSGSTRCGIYITPSSGTKGFSNGVNPTPITDHPTDIPADTRAEFITFTSQRDGSWEAYVVNLDGTGLKNLSNSPTSSDGLPTISPDGAWVAFVSNRDGVWAVWVTPIAGGEVQKLFDLPDPTPWGVNDYDWMSESISWGP
jgi:hypothetical protein